MSDRSAPAPAPEIPERAFERTETSSRANRLVAAAEQLISEGGVAAASARSVAVRAGAAASAINYNFGGIERLLSTAFERGRRRTETWLEARRREIAALPASSDGVVRALEYVVREWTVGARPLALLYQEALAAGSGAPWTALWRDFWLEAAAGFGLGEIEGRLMHLFFESEGLYHLSTWSPALETAALRELADHFGAVWLGASPGGVVGALALAERSAGAHAYSALAPAAARIAVAAAGVAEGGLGELTHRAVAARAGVTTGAITHHFRTIEELVAGAIRGQVLAISPADGVGVEPGEQTGEAALSAEDFLGAMRFHATADQPGGPALRRRNLFLAAVRRPELAGCAAVIRFAHGGNTRRALERLVDLPADALSLQAGVMSRFSAALWFATIADAEPQESRERLFAAIAARCFAV